MTEYEKVQLKVYLPPEVRAMLDELAEYWAQSNSALVEELITVKWKQLQSVRRQ